MIEKKEETYHSNQDSAEGIRGTVVEHFGSLMDPRINRTKRHKLIDIIFIAISATICGADNWKKIEVFAQSKKPWLQTVLSLPNGIPSHVTFWRVFRRINPNKFQECFVSWIRAVFETVDGEVIAIDGKTMRGSGTNPLHIVSAWSSAHNITLAQLKVKEKSNEIKAVPNLLEMIDLRGAIVTADAMSCQKAIAEQIVAGGGDYILALKGNQGSTHDEIRNYFTQAIDVDFEGVEYDSFSELDKGHGRIESRSVYVTADIDWLPTKEQWSNLNSIVMVVRECTRKGKTSKEISFYITSLLPTAKKIANGIRTHWGIENQVHWMLDVNFGEDKNQLSGDGAENFSLLSKIAMNLLKQEKNTKLSINNKRFKAAMDQSYLETILRIAA